MKAAKKSLALVLIALMVLTVLPLSARAADYTVNTQEDLDDALEATPVGGTATIKLMASFDYHGGIVIDNRDITFNLSGYTLNVTNAIGHGLEVRAGGVVDIAGTGEFNVESSAASGYGVYAHDGGQATVSYATAYGQNGVGAYAESGSKITVVDSVYAGDEMNSLGVWASGSGSDVTVNEDVYVEGDYGTGVVADEGATATIDEGVEVGGDNAIGVKANTGGQVTLNGDLEVYGANALGVQAQDDPDHPTSSTVYINGMFTVLDDEYEDIESYIEWFGGTKASAADGAEEGEYLYFTDEMSRVYVKRACMIGETVYSTLDEARAAATGAETTIKLLRNIEYYSGIVVEGKTIIFDLNGYELFVADMTAYGNGLEVGAGGVVDITDTSTAGDGVFYAHSGYNYGVYAHDGGQVTVTNAVGYGGSVRAEEGAEVHVRNWASGQEVGVSAAGGSTVIVDVALEGSHGNPYVMLGEVEKSEADGVVGTGDDTGYLIYSDGSNTVRVKTHAACRLSLTTVDETHVSLHDELGNALDAVNSALAGSEATITLLTDIDYDSGLSVYFRDITFDLNGYTLDVTNDEGNGLEVGEGGIVRLAENDKGGEFNVTSSYDYHYGVYAEAGGQATVTNAMATGTNGAGAAAYGSGSSIEVKGNVIRSSVGESVGISAGVVTVGGEVTVRGNVAVSSVKSALGVFLANNGTVFVGGDLTVYGEEAESIFGGVVSNNGGTAIINGVFTMPNGGAYIRLMKLEGESNIITEFVPADGVPGTAPYEDYLVYTDEINAVYVKIPVGATISPTSEAFDKNPAKQADVSATITWNDVESVTDVKAGGTSIGRGNYSVNGNTLTIKKEYLATKADGDLVLTVEFDDGGSVTLTITVSKSATGTGSGSSGNGPAYSSRTLTDSETGVTVSGDRIHRMARLTVSQLKPHPSDTCAACDAIREAQTDGQLILGYDISLTPAATGPLTISIPVGSQYSGQTVAILHCVNGRLETITATVVNGMATFTASSLSPFAVTTGLLVPDSVVTNPPKTGDAAKPISFVMLGLAVSCVAMLAIKRRKA